MAQQYDIILCSQLGDRHGSLLLDDGGDRVTGTISLLGFDNPVCGRRNGQRLELVHELRTTVSTISCRTEMTFCGGQLHGVVYSESGVMVLRGEKAIGAA